MDAIKKFIQEWWKERKLNTISRGSPRSMRASLVNQNDPFIPLAYAGLPNVDLVHLHVASKGALKNTLNIVLLLISIGASVLAAKFSIPATIYALQEVENFSHGGAITLAILIEIGVGFVGPSFIGLFTGMLVIWYEAKLRQTSLLLGVTVFCFTLNGVATMWNIGHMATYKEAMGSISMVLQERNAKKKEYYERQIAAANSKVKDWSDKDQVETFNEVKRNLGAQIDDLTNPDAAVNSWEVQRQKEFANARNSNIILRITTSGWFFGLMISCLTFGVSFMCSVASGFRYADHMNSKGLYRTLLDAGLKQASEKDVEGNTESTETKLPVESAHNSRQEPIIRERYDAPHQYQKQQPESHAGHAESEAGRQLKRRPVITDEQRHVPDRNNKVPVTGGLTFPRANKQQKNAEDQGTT